mgnify:CR=1 FL=1
MKKKSSPAKVIELQERAKARLGDNPDVCVLRASWRVVCPFVMDVCRVLCSDVLRACVRAQGENRSQRRAFGHCMHTVRQVHELREVCCDICLDVASSSGTRLLCSRFPPLRSTHHLHVSSRRKPLMLALRYVAHSYGASLICTSTKDKTQLAYVRSFVHVPFHAPVPARLLCICATNHVVDCLSPRWPNVHPHPPGATLTNTCRVHARVGVCVSQTVPCHAQPLRVPHGGQENSPPRPVEAPDHSVWRRQL